MATRSARILRLLTLASLMGLSPRVEAGDAYFIQRRAGAVDLLSRTDADGGNMKMMMRSAPFIRSFSVTTDGTRVLCHVLDDSDHSKPQSRIIMMDGSGTVLRTIDFASMGVRVFGTPVLLPNRTQIGLT